MLTRLLLEGGDSILIEDAAELDGPVKAGRVGDMIHELPTNLRAVLEPVIDTARTVADQLRKAGPAQVELELGVDLSMQAGAVITRGSAGSHLTVRLTWTSGKD